MMVSWAIQMHLSSSAKWRSTFKKKGPSARGSPIEPPAVPRDRHAVRGKATLLKPEGEAGAVTATATRPAFSPSTSRARTGACSFGAMSPTTMSHQSNGRMGPLTCQGHGDHEPQAYSRHAGDRQDRGAGFHMPFPSIGFVEKSGTTSCAFRFGAPCPDCPCRDCFRCGSVTLDHICGFMGQPDQLHLQKRQPEHRFSRPAPRASSVQIELAAGCNVPRLAQVLLVGARRAPPGPPKI
jgi:hypothetical protein